MQGFKCAFAYFVNDDHYKVKTSFCKIYNKLLIVINF